MSRMSAPERIWIHPTAHSPTNGAWFTERQLEVEIAYVPESTLSVVRREARAAAFREAIQIAKEEVFERRLADTVYERLLEAATTKQPETLNPSETE